SGGGHEQFWLYTFKPDEKQQSVDLELRLADGEYKTIAQARNDPGKSVESFETEMGGVAVTSVTEGPRGGAQVYVAMEHIDPAVRICAVDAQGTAHPAGNILSHSAGKLDMVEAEFELRSDQVTSIEVQVRPF